MTLLIAGLIFSTVLGLLEPIELHFWKNLISSEMQDLFLEYGWKEIAVVTKCE